MKTKPTVIAASVLCVFLTSGAAQAQSYQVPQQVREQAARYRQTAQELIAAGRVTDGVKMMRLAIKTNPVDPTLRMDYVRVMSRKGEQSLREGKRREAIVVFKNVETELLSAAKLLKDGGSPSNAAYALVQVGDIYRHVYRNEGTALAYYRKALELEPGSAEIKTKLNR